MGYLSEKQLDEIAELVTIVSVDSTENMDSIKFKCGVEEYDEFLGFAKAFSSLNISKTHLLFDNEHNELIGYMTLSSDTIRLNKREKSSHGLEEIPFVSIPALKIGKLAINKELKRKIKGYGSFLIEMARAHAFQLNENGIACRFLTVDADVEYDEGNIIFYEKNGFIENNRDEYKQQREKRKTVSMRMDIFNAAESEAICNDEKII